MGVVREAGCAALKFQHRTATYGQVRRMLTKKQRNALFNIIANAGLDLAKCRLELTMNRTEDGYVAGASITHEPTGSVFLLVPDSLNDEPPFAAFSLTMAVGDEAPRMDISRNDWSDIEERARVWAEGAKRFADTPDLWTELRTEKEVLSGAEYENMDNAPFTPDEQFRIAEQLREIKAHLVEQDSLSDERLSQIEAKLGEIEEASHRLGRKDWLNTFFGVMFTLIVTALVPPDAVQHVIAIVIHGLGDLFGFGSSPPSIPPVT